MKQTIAASVSIALVLGVLVASCSSDDESSSGTGGSGGAGATGGSGTGGSGTGGAGGSGTGGSGTGGSGTGGSGTGGSGGTGGLAGAGGSAGASAPTSDADCAAMTRAQECRLCCGDLHSEGQQAYDTAYTDCVCTADTCNDQCSQSVCASPANPGPTPSCNTCLGEQTAEGAACDPAAIQAACTDAGCAAYITCTNGCAG